MRSTFPSFATALAIAATSLVLDAAATPPKTLSYQGFLTSAADAPIDAPVQMTFKIYAVPTGGVALWSETQPSVTVAKGEFNATFGVITPLTLPFDVPYYLGVTVGSDPEMVPRQPLAASAYAFRALSLDGGAVVPGTIVTGVISTATISGAQVTGDLSGASNIDLANSTLSVGNIVKNGNVFLHNFGSGNVFLGTLSGNFTMTGLDNTAVGGSNLAANTTGSFNTAFGQFSLSANTTGSGNTAIGQRTLSTNTTGTNNTAVGNNALFSTTTGASMTAVGQGALQSATTAGNNVAVGTDALLNDTVGSTNVALGTNAMISNTTASRNTAVGDGALAFQSFSNGGVVWNSMNTAVGYSALVNNQPTTTADGINNTAVGALALSSNTNGIDNTAVGENALSANITGQFNTAVGMQTMLHNTIGQLNTALGLNALNNNTTGSSNIAIGNQSQFSSQTASFNTSLGNGALNFNTSGQHNIAIGGNTLLNMTSGSDNTAIGEATMSQNIAGSNNTAVGESALNAATGSSNTALGFQAGVAVTSGNNNIEIGSLGLAVDDRVIRIGTVGTQTTAFMAGVRGVTTGSVTAIPVLIDVNGQLGTTSSSRTVKQDIADMGEASTVLERLRPVTFHYRSHPDSPLQFGLIAEEVAEVAPGLAARGPDGSIETVYYQFLAPMLLNEYQKQRRVIEALERRLSILEAKLGGTQ